MSWPSNMVWALSPVEHTHWSAKMCDLWVVHSPLQSQTAFLHFPSSWWGCSVVWTFLWGAWALVHPLWQELWIFFFDELWLFLDCFARVLTVSDWFGPFSHTSAPNICRNILNWNWWWISVLIQTFKHLKMYIDRVEQMLIACVHTLAYFFFPQPCMQTAVQTYICVVRFVSEQTSNRSLGITTEHLKVNCQAMKTHWIQFPTPHTSKSIKVLWKFMLCFRCLLMLFPRILKLWARIQDVVHLTKCVYLCLSVLYLREWCA